MDRAGRIRSEHERYRERVFWSDQDQWPFDAPDHIFLARAVNAVSDKWGKTRADAIMALREHFAYGRLDSFLQTLEGQFIPVPAHAWNTWDFRDWLRECRASKMIAQPHGWHPLATVPELSLYVGREPFERLIAGQDGQTGAGLRKVAPKPPDPETLERFLRNGVKRAWLDNGKDYQWVCTEEMWLKLVEAEYGVVPPGARDVFRDNRPEAWSKRGPKPGLVNVDERLPAIQQYRPYDDTE